MKFIKSLIIAPLLFCMTFSLSSQDLFIYKDGNELEVKVLRINKHEIAYKKYSNLNGPEYTEEKANIFMIKYENGSKDIFKNTAENSNRKTNNVSNNENVETNQACTDSLAFIDNKWYVVCKENGKRLRYASNIDIQMYGDTKNENFKGTILDCGEKPKEPKDPFNSYQFKFSKEYKKYKKELEAWKECMGE